MEEPSEIKQALDNIKQDRVLNINLFGSVGTIILFIYSGINLVLQDYPACIFEFVCGAIILWSLFLINKKQKLEMGIAMGSLVLVLLSIHNFYSGGFNSTGFLWVIVMILILFYINGQNALVWVLPLEFILFGIFILKLESILTLPYDNFLIIMFFISTIVAIFLTYYFITKLEQGIHNLEKAYVNLEHAAKEIHFKDLTLKNSMQTISKQAEELEKYNKND